jgi:hypothetical protein
MKIAVAILLSLVAVGSVAQVGEQSDLDRYIEEIKASGMSEQGRTHIYTVASICTGNLILKYHHDEASGQYWPSYSGTTCPKPDADTPEIARWKKLMISETDQLVVRLRPFADSDKSGFVTTEEASDFRFLIEFGILAGQVFQEESADLDTLSRASGIVVGEVADRLEAYRTLARRITDSGVTVLPYPNLDTAAQGSE